MNRDEFTNCYTNCYICLWYEQHFSLNTITAHTERTLKQCTSDQAPTVCVVGLSFGRYLATRWV